ncbi:MAG: hypothetical protein A2033_17070 [Bacteroidetes bacterium GWA2_31_9]|nr:MAG: hypothetical protein A2033_17070 [Bacteroidetes bacterium GWA2_31_9]
MIKKSLIPIIFSLTLLLVIIAIGTIGYIVLEGYSFIDSLFMTFITISTVGFREVVPLSDTGKIFTIFLIIFSLGTFAYALSTFSKYIIDGVYNNLFQKNKIKKMIAKLENHVLVCGYGRNGKQAALELLDHNFNVVIIEKDDANIEKLKAEKKFLFIKGDATQDEILHEANIKNAKALISALPNDADNLFVVLTARELNPKLKIISRASDDNSDVKLKRAGASNVIMSDKIGGQHMAKLVAQPDVLEFLEHILLQKSKDVALVEVSCENIADYFVDKSIREFDIRNASGANIVGLRKDSGQYILNPTPDVVLSANDKLFVLGNPNQILKLREILRKNL